MGLNNQETLFTDEEKVNYAQRVGLRVLIKLEENNDLKPLTQKNISEMAEIFAESFEKARMESLMDEQMAIEEIANMRFA